MCAGKEWDVYYVVVNNAESRVKFGITSGDGRHRLAYHRMAGYADVVRLLEMPIARELENATLSALAMAGELPVWGREYFDISALPTILDIVDNWPIAAEVDQADIEDSFPAYGQLALFAEAV